MFGVIDCDQEFVSESSEVVFQALTLMSFTKSLVSSKVFDFL